MSRQHTHSTDSQAHRKLHRHVATAPQPRRNSHRTTPPDPADARPPRTSNPAHLNHGHCASGKRTTEEGAATAADTTHSAMSAPTQFRPARLFRRRPHATKDTWTGKIWGRTHFHILDYIAVDACTTPRLSPRHVGQSILLHTTSWNVAGRHRRSNPQPIRWTLPAKKQDEFRALLHHEMDEMPGDANLVTAAVQKAAALGRGQKRAHHMARHSTTERELHDELRRADTDAQRRAIRRRMHAARDAMRREKDQAQREYGLAHIADGGWGQSDLAPRLAEMPYLQHDATKAYESAHIAALATQHYKHIFENIPRVPRLRGQHSVTHQKLCNLVAATRFSDEDKRYIDDADVLGAFA